MRSLYVFGDSIAFGQFVSPHLTWCAKLSKLLEPENVLLQVTARNGETTRQALERFEFDVLHHRPDAVWIQFGINDANYWPSQDGRPRVAPNAFEHNLREMLNAALLRGCQRIILATNHPVTRHRPSPNGEDSLASNVLRYNDLIRKITGDVATNHVELFDFANILHEAGIPPEVYLLGDGVHLSVDGHALYASEAYDTLGIGSVTGPN